MSTEEEEENRLYQCLRKYQKIVKQFDELVEMMDVRARPPKRRRNTRGSSGSIDPPSANQPDNGEAFVQTITRFLHELKSNPTTDPDSSTSTRDRE
ncbi:Uncharacterized protein TCM_022160 [Theobroma cacao]|uniref:Uncharacterized protein n=1 Tax=Theobroma cacao TaxID=3641 RepID=A0A061ESM7_THECC|nr:Uncharacterized protein TCM_022160 [Theobroma cacao]